jgi:hypothetical protein
VALPEIPMSGSGYRLIGAIGQVRPSFLLLWAAPSLFPIDKSNSRLL